MTQCLPSFVTRLWGIKPFGVIPLNDDAILVPAEEPYRFTYNSDTESFVVANFNHLSPEAQKAVFQVCVKTAYDHLDDIHTKREDIKRRMAELQADLQILFVAQNEAMDLANEAQHQLNIMW